MDRERSINTVQSYLEDRKNQDPVNYRVQAENIVDCLLTDPEIQPGDVVTLKSGGPKMMVCSLEGEEVAKCVYFPLEANSPGTYQISPDTRDYSPEAQILEVQTVALIKVDNG